MDVVSIPARPLACVALTIVHRASVIQAGKQIVQLFKERYREM
jgi:hypothetical protein